MRNIDRIKEIGVYFDKNGMKSTKNKYNLKESSIQRNLRRYRNILNGTLSIDTRTPKIFLFDVETSPMECYTWGIYQQFLTYNNIIKPSAMLSWAGKWLFDDEIIGHRVNTSDATNRKDKNIVSKLYKYFDDADIIIAHNVKKFDYKVCNTRFILNGLTPPSPFKMIDTLIEIKKNFRFPCNKLGYISSILGDQEKQNVSFDLWHRSVTGDDTGLQDMLMYNKQDVRALEELYLRIRPWAKPGVNLGLYYDDMGDRCPNCGSKDIYSKGHYYTTVGRYRSIKCNQCGAVGRNKYQELTADDKRDLLRPVGI